VKAVQIIAEDCQLSVFSTVLFRENTSLITEKISNEKFLLTIKMKKKDQTAASNVAFRCQVTSIRY
jgi:hypothetical protein